MHITLSLPCMSEDGTVIIELKDLGKKEISRFLPNFSFVSQKVRTSALRPCKKAVHVLCEIKEIDKGKRGYVTYFFKHFVVKKGMCLTHILIAFK